MAISNVRSSAYRAAGNWKAWGRVTTGNNHLMMDMPKPAHIVEHIKDTQDKNDAYHLTKATIRDNLSEGYDESKVTVIPAGDTANKRKKRLTTKRR